ncbi:MAG: TIGR03087 family PEP-CTERM/XrtA system glycosyltransferase [Magnetococcales bacterium]|nr:TIGR03087 family PEP-CTERM/XrtA system glycosyltransferase [Magnetococcales bacterium]
MKDLLFLCHRIPYPPKKGDKIRSYHLLQFLARRYRIHLGAFIDNPEDWQHTTFLDEMIGGKSCYVGLNPRWSKIGSLSGFLTGEALTFPYYRNQQMAQWVDQILADHDIDQIVVFSAALAQYVLHKPARLIIDFVDVDSDKWRQYAMEQGGLNGWVFGREARKLQAKERALAQAADASFLVSEAEARLFRTIAPDAADKIHFWENGVDQDYFSPDRTYENPYTAQQIPLVFTGAMDYRPNVDAVVWFARDIFPIIRQAVEKAHFFIVGGGPTAEVLALGNRPGITVTGRVADVRPYIAHGRVSIAPMRLARGVQNKVLEALAMARPVVATSQAMEGIRLCPGLEQWITDDEANFAGKVLAILADQSQPVTKQQMVQLGSIGRRCVIEHYNWQTNLQRVLSVMKG